MSYNLSHILCLHLSLRPPCHMDIFEGMVGVIHWLQEVLTLALVSSAAALQLASV